MNPWAELDRLVLDRVKTSAPTGLRLTYLFAREVRAGEVRDEVERIAAETVRDPMRALDARLQALRKAGRLTHDRRRGWMIGPALSVPTPTSPTGERAAGAVAAKPRVDLKVKGSAG